MMPRLPLTIAVPVIAVILTGCAPSDQLDTIMGRTEGTAVPAPQRLLDCDLIFPAPARDTLAP